MNGPKSRSRILAVVGLSMVLMGTAAYVVDCRTFRDSDSLSPGLMAFRTVVHVLNGMVDPASSRMLLSGLTLPGCGLVTAGAFLSRSRYHKFVQAALVLGTCGLIAGLGGFLDVMDGGDFILWRLGGYAYPIGVIMSCVGAVLVIIESFRGSLPVAKDDAEG